MLAESRYEPVVTTKVGVLKSGTDHSRIVSQFRGTAHQNDSDPWRLTQIGWDLTAPTCPIRNHLLHLIIDGIRCNEGPQRPESVLKLLISWPSSTRSVW